MKKKILIPIFYLYVTSNLLFAEYDNLAIEKKTDYEACIKYLEESNSIIDNFKEDLPQNIKCRLYSFSLEENFHREHFIYAEIFERNLRLIF